MSDRTPHPTVALLRRLDPGINTTLLVLFALSFIPLAIMLNLSFKSIPQYEYERWIIKPPFHLANYLAAWQALRTYLCNSVIISAASAAGVIALSALGGYAFARGRFPLREPLFIFILCGMMIPGILYLVPKFILFRNLNLVNSRWGLLLAYWTEGQIFGIFLFRSHFESLPDGLFESAQMDGAGVWAQFRHIALPLSAPIISTLAVMNLMFTWNDIIWPWIVITDDRLRTISIGMSIFQQSFLENRGPMFAGYTIAALPLILIFCFTSRYFIKGLTSGAFKA
jgi:ABC-type glycerol-3-phosphate transport system permease component